jgi:MFS family permease
VRLFLIHLGVIYTIFAATGLTYATFIVTTMVDSFSLPTAKAGLLWAGVGGLSIFSGALFGSVSDRFGHRAGMSCALAVQAVAYGLVATNTGLSGLYVSIVLFGLSAWSMPSIVAAAAGDFLGPKKVASGFAILTTMFAAGQVAGPASAGVLADWAGSFGLSYGIAAALNVAAVLLCLALRLPSRAASNS